MRDTTTEIDDNNINISSHRCSCSEGKGVQGDGKSCDWNYYMYMGGDKWITLSKTGKKTLTIMPEGKVLSMDHDYKKNLIFFSEEVGMKPNLKYRIRSYHPKHKFRTIVNGKLDFVIDIYKVH